MYLKGRHIHTLCLQIQLLRFCKLCVLHCHLFQERKQETEFSNPLHLEIQDCKKSMNHQFIPEFCSWWILLFDKQLFQKRTLEMRWQIAKEACKDQVGSDHLISNKCRRKNCFIRKASKYKLIFPSLFFKNKQNIINTWKLLKTLEIRYPMIQFLKIVLNHYFFCALKYVPMTFIPSSHN